jgi:hypothetical protein
VNGLWVWMDVHGETLELTSTLWWIAGWAAIIWVTYGLKRKAVETADGLLFSSWPFQFAWALCFLPTAVYEIANGLAESSSTHHYVYTVWLYGSLLLMALIALSFGPQKIVLESEGIRFKRGLLLDRWIAYKDVAKIIRLNGAISVRSNAGPGITFAKSSGYPDEELFEREVTRRSEQHVMPATWREWFRRT